MSYTLYDWHIRFRVDAFEHKDQKILAEALLKALKQVEHDFVLLEVRAEAWLDWTFSGGSELSRARRRAAWVAQATRIRGSAAVRWGLSRGLSRCVTSLT